MEYRLRRAGAARHVIPAVAAAAVLAAVGTALLQDDAPSTLATFTPPSTTSAERAPEPVPTSGAPTLPATPDDTTAPPTTAEPLPTTTTPATSTSTSTTTTLPDPPLEPVAPPSDPRGAEELIQLGGISIPKIGLDAPLMEGIRLTTLDHGPGHWPGTAMPGQVGNVVVAAHRTSHGGPFRHIDQLVTGDTVEFATDAGIVTYVVTGTQIVNPDAIWIVDQTDTPTATLFACHPPGSVAQRFVVNLELAS